jgi:hypothetical protein
MPERVTGSRGTVHGRKVVEANKAHLTSAWERREREWLRGTVIVRLRKRK